MTKKLPAKIKFAIAKIILTIALFTACAKVDTEYAAMDASDATDIITEIDATDLSEPSGVVWVECCEEIEDLNLAFSDLSLNVNGHILKPLDIDGKIYFFLPSSVNLSSVNINYTADEGECMWIYDGSYQCRVNADEVLDDEKYAV